METKVRREMREAVRPTVLDAAPDDNWIDVCPWQSRRVLLILRLGSGDVYQASSKPAKRELLREKGGLLMVVWPGEWSSTVRVIDPWHRARVLEALG
jgi:hypothetical protein